ncbi:MAG: hypothetical protein U9Q89_03155 [Thermodesulfobacteriota bacterium]|nr:hypothetical protein [Thermodesulfobacteriota bacterium]
MRVRQVIAEDGKVVITDLPYKKGQPVEIICIFRSGIHNSWREVMFGKTCTRGLISVFSRVTLSVPYPALLASDFVH